MRSITNYKDSALESLKGKWDKGVIATLIYLLIAGLPSGVLNVAVKNAGTLWSLLVIPLAWGLTVYFLSIARREEDLSYERLFDGYRDFVRIFLTTFLSGIYIILWSLLLIVPGIIKYYSYSMVSYILKDDPTLKNNAAIEKSMKMMEGHKMQLFLLDLSFLGWVLLSCLTLGLGFLLLIPYLQTTRAHFYEDLKAETEGFVMEEATVRA